MRARLARAGRVRVDSHKVVCSEHRNGTGRESQADGDADEGAGADHRRRLRWGCRL